MVMVEEEVGVTKPLLKAFAAREMAKKIICDKANGGSGGGGGSMSMSICNLCYMPTFCLKNALQALSNHLTIKLFVVKV